MTDLPDVSLVCVDTRTPERALQAIGHCTAGLTGRLPWTPFSSASFVDQDRKSVV